MSTAPTHFSSADAEHTTLPNSRITPVLVGYLFWVIGFTGAHRFFFGKPLTGVLFSLPVDCC